ncbi:MAG: hypothetical protein GY801_38560 [bacterium]|nr:hypothetical protein [bacterium]
MIHIVGDSHARLFRRPFCYFTHYLGPVTMHKVGRDGVESVMGNKHKIRNGDSVIFVFGEIDVRCHIGKQKNEKKRPLSEIIGMLVSNYVSAITDYRGKFRSLNCIVQLVVPPCNPPAHHFNPKYPYHGLLEDRIRINELLNNCLKAHCASNEINVLDLSSVVSKQGQLNPSMSDGNVHIGESAFPMCERLLLAQLKPIEKIKIILLGYWENWA